MHKNAWKSLQKRIDLKIEGTQILCWKQSPNSTTFLQIDPMPYAMTHFSIVLFSCKNMSAFCNTHNMQQQQTVSFLVHVWLLWHVLAATHCSWQHTLFAEPSSVHRHSTCICWDVSRRIQRSDNYDKSLRHCWHDDETHPAVEPTAWMGLFRIHINVVFKNVLCKLHCNVRRGCSWHDVNSESVRNFVRRKKWQSEK